MEFASSKHPQKSKLGKKITRNFDIVGNWNQLVHLCAKPEKSEFRAKNEVIFIEAHPQYPVSFIGVRQKLFLVILLHFIFLFLTRLKEDPK